MASSLPSSAAAASAATSAQAEAGTGAAGPSLLPPIPRATSIIVIGMAGSGKSTFTSALSRYSAQPPPPSSSPSPSPSPSTSPSTSSSAAPAAPTPPYMVNLDPAVGTLGYSPNVDIRDTVDYHRVMAQYNLGPNGGILTALNLFTTKFDQVLAILEARAAQTDHIVLDTPGQIEIFTWSASGAIVTDALASAMPTVVAYIIDTPRTTAPATFMSNMLYACSILYKTKLPFVLVFNKTDAQPHGFALEWMHDFEAFQEALRAGNATEPSALALRDGVSGRGRGPTEEQGYMNSLMNSMSLVLDEFYKNLRTVGVSSLTGDGLDSFFSAVAEARQEYITDYRPDLERLAASRQSKRDAEKRAQLARLMADMEVSSLPAPARRASHTSGPEETVDEEYDGDGQIIEPDSDEEKPHYEYPGPGYELGDGTVWPRPG